MKHFLTAASPRLHVTELESRAMITTSYVSPAGHQAGRRSPATSIICSFPGKVAMLAAGVYLPYHINLFLPRNCACVSPSRHPGILTLPKRMPLSIPISRHFHPTEAFDSFARSPGPLTLQQYSHLSTSTFTSLALLERSHLCHQRSEKRPCITEDFSARW